MSIDDFNRAIFGSNPFFYVLISTSVGLMADIDDGIENMGHDLNSTTSMDDIETIGSRVNSTCMHVPDIH